MKILENVSLRSYNTFGIDVYARKMLMLEQKDDLAEFLTEIRKTKEPMLIIGGGSNLLFTGDFPGTVLKPFTRGIEVVEETEREIFLKVAAGEVWDDVVQHCVRHGWGGVENLSGIPGQTGAAPIQNIGAYGVELRDVFYQLDAVDLNSGEHKVFEIADCQFGYRQSVFKNRLRSRFFIESVTLRLQKQPRLILSYGSVYQELKDSGIETPNLEDVREVICSIRRRKLPDPAITGNAGSFFKNPVIRKDQFESLRNIYPDIVHYPDPDGIKLAAAWLIESTGWKGIRSGDAGVHPGHPLVLVNYGQATGEEILDLAARIRQSVLSRYSILLEPEVNII